MPNYRVYTVIRSDKVAGRADVVTCATDAEAVVKARQFLQSNDLEIWQGARMVSRLNAQDRVATERPANPVTQHDAYSQTGR
jgi:hypothetical protein